MTDSRPLFYQSSREFQEFTSAQGDTFARNFAAALAGLDDLGADSNERLSALAHWLAQGIDLAADIVLARVDQLRPNASADERTEAVDLFIGAAVLRAVTLRAERAGKANPQ